MRLALFSFLGCATLSAATLDPTLLNHDQASSFSLQTKKVQAEAGKLAGAWINPIKMSYGGSFKKQFGYNQESYSGAVSINQPIFKSGGIWFAINYASATEYYNKLGIKLQKKSVIKEVVSMMMTLRKLDLSIKKMQLQIQDAKATFLDNQEQNTAGEVDEAIVNLQAIALNNLELMYLDLLNQKAGFIQKLSIFSDANYKTVTLPVLTLVSNKKFLEKSYEVKQAIANNSVKSSYRNMMIAKYLPTFNVTASYNYSKSVNQAFGEKFTIPDSETNFANVGFSLSMIVDVNAFRDVQSAQVDLLKSSVTLSQKQKEMNTFYTMVVTKVQNIDKKIALSQENEKLYAKVLSKTQQAFKSGDTSILAVQKSEHQLAMKKLDTQSYSIDKQLELLALYEKISD